jgi:hypothetical protein
MTKRYTLFIALLIGCIIVSCKRENDIEIVTPDNPYPKSKLEAIKDTYHDPDILDYSRIYLVSNVYDIDVVELKDIVNTYLKGFKLIGFESSYNYNDLLDEIGKKHNLSRKEVSKIILAYTNGL